jgi:hypothetical protein
MRQDRSFPTSSSIDLSGLLRSNRLQIIVGSHIAILGIVAASIATFAALHAPLDIRGFLDSENAGSAYGPDFTSAWVWGLLAAIGIVVLIVGLVRGARTHA